MAIRDRERIVKLSRVCEITHAELVEPFKRARLALTADEDIDNKLSRVHRI
ncbi:MAG TPA: hypothetical protein VKH45_05570 [Candidatus Acidoferrum sp.]|nr:hypothetical protein [Candidatus Acidoferrum sp.]